MASCQADSELYVYDDDDEVLTGLKIKAIQLALQVWWKLYKK